MTTAERRAILKRTPSPYTSFCRKHGRLGVARCDTCREATCGQCNTKRGKIDACPRHARAS